MRLLMITAKCEELVKSSGVVFDDETVDDIVEDGRGGGVERQRTRNRLVKWIVVERVWKGGELLSYIRRHKQTEG